MVYIDRDPQAYRHRRLRYTTTRTAHVHADTRRAWRTVLSHPDVERLVDFSSPVDLYDLVVPVARGLGAFRSSAGPDEGHVADLTELHELQGIALGMRTVRPAYAEVIISVGMGDTESNR